MVVTVQSDGAQEDPTDSLSRAAMAIKHGDEIRAAAELESFLQQQPQAHLFRFQLASIYHRRQQHGRARYHYERFLAALPLVPNTSLLPYAIEAHTRLCEYAADRQDIFAEVFHRGLGLLLLAEAAKPVNLLLADELLGQARQALKQAQQLRPNHPQLTRARYQLYRLAGQASLAQLEQAALEQVPLPQPITPTLTMP